MEYSEKVLDHFTHPRNVGKIDDADGVGEVGNASSLATELIKGKPLDYAMGVTNKQVVDELGGLPEHKIHCSVLAEEAIRAAIEDYRSKHSS